MMAALWRRICSCWALWGTCVHLRCVVWFSLCALHVEHAYVHNRQPHDCRLPLPGRYELPDWVFEGTVALLQFARSVR
jgi:hypothetical protein